MSDSSLIKDLKNLYEELQASIRGPLHFQDDSNFVAYSTIFNGNVITVAKVVVCPLNAEDVSKILVFCAEHKLSPSVKAGGYGTAGWAVGGDIIIDLHRLGEVDIETPKPDGSFTSLRDMAPANSKGKKAITATPNTTDIATTGLGKRRRDEDAALRMYDMASRAVAMFLRGGHPTPTADGARPSVRRRLNPEDGTDTTPDLPARGDGGGPTSTTINGASVINTINFAPSSTTNGSTGSVPSQAPVTSRAPANADPFGYLDAPAPAAPAVLSMQANFNNSASYTAGTSTIVANPRLPPANLSMPSQSAPVHAHAYVTFGAGMRQKEIDTYTANHPLEALSLTGENEVVPYHVPFSAHPVGSSIMILGGFGFLSRLHGLSIDNLVEVEMVLADGRIVIVNENDYPDLWWALRGAGPALGIATRYKAKAFPVPVVFAGNLIYRFHKATAPSLIKHFRDCVKGAPRELYANVLLTAGPQGKDSLIVIQMCYIGPKEKGQEYLAAISSWDGEKCLLNEVDEKSFLHQQDSVAQVLRGKAGRQWFIRSALITSLPDEIINKTVLQFADTPIGCTWLFELAGGAISDYEDTCVPKVQREASFTIAALHQWEMGLDDPRCQESAEEWIAGTLGPVQTGGPFPSFLGRHESADRTMACYGDNWKRLCEIKQLYDPNNLFRNTLWPLDASGASVEPQSHEPPTPEMF